MNELAPDRSQQKTGPVLNLGKDEKNILDIGCRLYGSTFVSGGRRDVDDQRY